MLNKPSGSDKHYCSDKIISLYLLNVIKKEIIVCVKVVLAKYSMSPIFLFSTFLFIIIIHATPDLLAS